MSSHECDVCKKIFSRPSHVVRHKKDVHKITVCSAKENSELSSEKMYKCSDCDKTFSRPAHVRRHQLSAHINKKSVKRNSQTLLPKAPLEIKQESPVEYANHECDLCKKKFSRPALLLRHKSQVHKLNVSESMTKVTKNYKCSMCPKRFKYKKNSRKHERTVHRFMHPATVELKCSECKESFFNVKEFLGHFSLRHSDISLTTEEFSFQTREEFQEWKLDVEKTSSSSFVCARSYRTASSDFVKIFVCHRNGKFKSLSTGKRHIKLRGSNKINYFCPSRIYYTMKLSGEVKVKYISKHLGHQCDSGRLRLSKNEKDGIACQLQIGVPMQKILLKISEEASNDSRLSMTTMQDIRNVASSYNINSSEKRDNNDVLSVDSWVNEMLNEENSPILLYKSSGEVKPEYPAFEKDDFLLAFMNDAQKEIFKLYGESVVAIDSTHGTSVYNIQLTTIIVRDSNSEGFPVAFLWSNKMSEVVFSLFFSAIKRRIEEINTLTFMSDDYPAYYNAWEKVFGAAHYHILCDWHVKRAWAKNISSGTHKIVNLDKRKLVLEHLTLLINETDLNTFSELLEMKKSFVDEDTRSFWTYFHNNYENRIHMWAHCFRIGAQINVNMSIEQWHKYLKYNSDLKGKCGGRLDKAIHSLIKSLRLKLMSRFSTISRGKLTKKVVLLRKAHEIATKNFATVSVQCVDNYWYVSSFTTADKVYKVIEVEVDPLHTCNMTCDSCNRCLHQFVCNCPESSIRYNYCKHSHIVGLFLSKKNFSEPDNLEDNVPLEIDASERIDCERNAIQKELQSTPRNSLQEKANEAVKRALEVIGTCSSDEQFRLVISSMNTLTANLASLENSDKYLKPIEKLIPNKNIEPQRRFPLKKKKLGKK